MGISYKRKRVYDEEVDLGVSSASEDEAASKFERTRSTFKKQNEVKKQKKVLLPIKQKGKLVQKVSSNQLSCPRSHVFPKTFSYSPKTASSL